MDESQLKTWKKFTGLWFVLPIVVYLGFICSKVDVIINRHIAEFYMSSRSPINEDSFRFMLMSFEMGLLVIIVGNKKLINFFGQLFFVAGIVSVYHSMFQNVQRFSNRIAEKGLFFSQNYPRFVYWNHLFDEFLFELGGLIVNMITLVILGVCDFLKERDGREGEHQDGIWNIKIGWDCKICKWIYHCLLISAFLSLATVFTTVTIQLCHLVIEPYSFKVFGYKIIMERLFWMITYISVDLFGLYKYYQYYKKENDDNEESSIKNLTVHSITTI